MVESVSVTDSEMVDASELAVDEDEDEEVILEDDILVEAVAPGSVLASVFISARAFVCDDGAF